MTKKKKKSLSKPLNPRMGVTTSGSAVRHVSTSIQYAEPICGDGGRGTGNSWLYWTASKSAQRHTLPICKKCIRMIQKLNSDLQNDPGWIEATVGMDKLLEDKTSEFMDLLSEYGEWHEDD